MAQVVRPLSKQAPRILGGGSRRGQSMVRRSQSMVRRNQSMVRRSTGRYAVMSGRRK